VSTPTDASVLFALSAILGLDQRALFEKAGVEMPREDSHLTIEESLASLAPLPMDDLSFDPDEPAENEKPEPVAHVDSLRPDASLEPGMDALEDDDEPDLDADSELEAEVEEHLERAAPLGPEHQSVDAPAAGDSDRAADREPDPVFEPFSPGLADFTPLLSRARDRDAEILLSDAFFADHGIRATATPWRDLSPL